MNDLIRPAMYEAYHDIVPIEQQNASRAEKVYDVWKCVRNWRHFRKERRMNELLKMIWWHSDLLAPTVQ